MSLEDYIRSPWGKSHEFYSNGALVMSPAPEYATSEISLSSLYRVIGLPEASEKKVPSQSAKLLTMIKNARGKASSKAIGALDPDSFETLLSSVLESPKSANQSVKRYLQITPLVPQVALFSGAPRQAGNPWTPGNLIRRMVWLGSENQVEAETIWRRLFEALTVNENDDVFARFLQSEFNAWMPEYHWTYIPAPASEISIHLKMPHAVFPARQFVRDLNSIIGSKHLLTRRQWISLLESVIRLATVAHVMWLCEVHARIWDCLSDAINGTGPKSEEDAQRFMYPDRFAFLPLSNQPLPGIRDSISRYLTARLSINAVLWDLEKTTEIKTAVLNGPKEVTKICEQLRKKYETSGRTEIRKTIEELVESENRTLLCRKGIGSKIMEFVTSSLQQRQTANPRLRGYDQGYVLRKRGPHIRSPWIVSFGPVATIALVHCSLCGVIGPRSVHRLTQHLSQYGVAMDHRDIPQNELGQQLRMLGLVLDSPDAESGMLLVPPFRQSEMNEAHS